MKENSKVNKELNRMRMKKAVNNLVVAGAVAFGAAVMLSEYFIRKLTGKEEKEENQ